MNFLKILIFSLNFFWFSCSKVDEKRYKISLPKTEDVSLVHVSINIY